MAELTTDERAYQKRLETLYEALRTSSADPATSIAARTALQPRIAELANQLDDIQAGVFHQGTGVLQAAADGIAPAMKQLELLKADLARVAKDTKEAVAIAGYVQAAIGALQTVIGV
ncbi:MAG TPA: hypothetical protein VGD62_05615 [Acidobacteriaceae bacterium]